jgi:cytochrome c-type protein NapC
MEIVVQTLKNLWQFLAKPSARYSVLVLLVVGLVAGAVSVITFELSLAATSTEQFCTSCHEMADNPGMMLVGTTHHMNRSGVRPTCSDCHVPREFIPKMIRKVEAAREVWGSITGVIDTPEKYAAHAPAMKAREIARLKANDSQECRNCHDVDHMVASLQSKKAQNYHKAGAKKDKTCIDCHAGLTHTPPEPTSAAASPY